VWCSRCSVYQLPRIQSQVVLTRSFLRPLHVCLSKELRLSDRPASIPSFARQRRCWQARVSQYIYQQWVMSACNGSLAVRAPLSKALHQGQRQTTAEHVCIALRQHNCIIALTRQVLYCVPTCRRHGACAYTRLLEKMVPAVASRMRSGYIPEVARTPVSKIVRA
jgi:hypothetical protein